MILAGRLTGTLDGRPVVIDAIDSGVVVTFATMASAWSVRHSAASLLPVLSLARRLSVAVRVNVAGLATLEILPRPSRVVRLLTPRLSELL